MAALLELEHRPCPFSVLHQCHQRDKPPRNLLHKWRPPPHLVIFAPHILRKFLSCRSSAPISGARSPEPDPQLSAHCQLHLAAANFPTPLDCSLCLVCRTWGCQTSTTQARTPWTTLSSAALCTGHKRRSQLLSGTQNSTEGKRGRARRQGGP